MPPKIYPKLYYKEKEIKQETLITSAYIECLCIRLAEFLNFRPDYINEHNPSDHSLYKVYVNETNHRVYANLPTYNIPAGEWIKLSEYFIYIDENLHFTENFFYILGRALAWSWYTDDIDGSADNLFVRKNERGVTLDCRRYDFDCAFGWIQDQDSSAQEKIRLNLSKINPVFGNNVSELIDYYLQILTLNSDIYIKDKLKYFKKECYMNFHIIEKGFYKELQDIVNAAASPQHQQIIQSQLSYISNDRIREGIKNTLEERISTAKQFLSESTMDNPNIINYIDQLNNYLNTRCSEEEADYKPRLGFLFSCAPFFQGYSKIMKKEQASTFCEAIRTNVNLNEFINNKKYSALRQGKLGGIFKNIIKDAQSKNIIDMNGNFLLHRP